MNKFFKVSCLVLVASATCALGQTLNLTTTNSGFAAGETEVVLSDNSAMPAGNWVSVGLYDTVDFNAINQDLVVNQSELAALFSDYLVFSGNVSGGSFDNPGSYFVEIGQADVTGTVFENQTAFVTIFKTADNSSNLGDNWSNVTEIGVYSSSTAWNFGTLGANLTDVEIFRTEDADLFLVGSSGSLKTVAVVPEPSHFAALFGLIGFGLVMWRRRRG